MDKLEGNGVQMAATGADKLTAPVVVECIDWCNFEPSQSRAGRFLPLAGHNTGTVH